MGMASRAEPIVTGRYYHVMNRGVEKRITFIDDQDYQRFLSILAYYQHEKPPISYSQRFRLKIQPLGLDVHDWGPKLVDIVSYCLMPNHFHLLLQQCVDGGIPLFLGRVTNSYTRAFNTRNHRIGSLFQGVYKSVGIYSNEQLVHVVRYHHLNPMVAQLAPTASDYQWSSHRAYLKPSYPTPGVGYEKEIRSRAEIMITPDVVRQQFGTPNSFNAFVNDHASYADSLALIKRLILEES